MSTAAVGAGVVEGVGTLTTEQKTYRGYVKLDEKGDISSHKAQVGAQKLYVNPKDAADPANGTPVNWKKLEDEGYQNLNELDLLFYTVKSEDGAKLLVPEEAQRVYIFQCGLNYVQNAAANSYATELKEGTQDPAYSGGTVIDLRDAINEPPTRRGLTEIDKLIKLLTAMGVPPEKQASVLEAMIAAKAPAVAEQQEQEEGVAV